MGLQALIPSLDFHLFDFLVLGGGGGAGEKLLVEEEALREGWEEGKEGGREIAWNKQASMTPPSTLDIPTHPWTIPSATPTLSPFRG